MSCSVERKIALSVSVTVIERNPKLGGVVVMPGFSILCDEDSLGTSVNSLNFFPCHSDLCLSRQFIRARNDGSLILSHRGSGCASRAEEPTSVCQQKQLFHH